MDNLEFPSYRSCQYFIQAYSFPNFNLTLDYSNFESCNFF